VILAAMLLAAASPAPQAVAVRTQAASPRDGAIVADPAKAPEVAPDIPLTTGDQSKGRPAPKDDLAALSDGDSPKEIEPVWKDIASERRRLLIMGSSDGAAAAGAAAPCFPGRDASRLDDQLIAAGFGGSYAERLPEALARIAASSTACAAPTQRTYGADFVVGLPNDDLAVYVTGAVRAYARVRPCAAESQSAAASAAVSALRNAGTGTGPVEALRSGLDRGCAAPAAR
jgi:hypothetical protein